MIFSFLSKYNTGYRNISVSDLSSLPSGARIIDVREPSEYAADHLPTAELVPLGTLATAAAAWDRTVPYVLLCRSGGRSSRGATELVGLGFQNVLNVTGGMLAVRARGLS